MSGPACSFDSTGLAPSEPAKPDQRAAKDSGEPAKPDQGPGKLDQGPGKPDQRPGKPDQGPGKLDQGQPPKDTKPPPPPPDKGPPPPPDKGPPPPPPTGYGKPCATKPGPPKLCADAKSMCIEGLHNKKGFCTKSCNPANDNCPDGPGGVPSTCNYKVNGKSFCAFLCKDGPQQWGCPAGLTCHPYNGKLSFCWP